MSDYIHNSHNITVLVYHLVFLAKYRRVVFGTEVDDALIEVFLDTEERYKVKFLETGTVKGHVHFLLQSIPSYGVTKKL